MIQMGRRSGYVCAIFLFGLLAMNQPESVDGGVVRRKGASTGKIDHKMAAPSPADKSR